MEKRPQKQAHRYWIQGHPYSANVQGSPESPPKAGFFILLAASAIPWHPSASGLCRGCNVSLARVREKRDDAASTSMGTELLADILQLPDEALQRLAEDYRRHREYYRAAMQRRH